MGFSLKKWTKHAFKPPKSVRKLQLGHVILPAVGGFLVGGPGGLALGVAKGTVSEAGRVRATTNLPPPDNGQPLVAVPDAESRQAPDIDGGRPSALNPMVMVGIGVAVVVVVVVLARRR